MKKRELIEQAAKRHNVPAGVEGACEMLSDDTQDLLGLGDDQYGETADSVAEFAAQLLND